MVAMDLDNVYDVVSNISKFAATIFANLFNHKGKEENNGNMTMECDWIISHPSSVNTTNF